MEQDVKTSEEAVETSLSATLMVDEVQPTYNGVTDSEHNDADDNESINKIIIILENNTFGITAH